MLAKKGPGRRKRPGGRLARGLSGLISQALGTRMDNTVLRRHTLKPLQVNAAPAFDLFVFWNLCLCGSRGDKISVNGRGSVFEEK